MYKINSVFKSKNLLKVVVVQECVKLYIYEIKTSVWILVVKIDRVLSKKANFHSKICSPVQSQNSLRIIKLSYLKSLPMKISVLTPKPLSYDA